jgi:hypothetical protein
MTPAEALAAAQAAGVTIEARIWCDEPDSLPPPVRAVLRAHRAEVLRLLVDPAIHVLCGRCGAVSQQFVAIENPTGWTCSTCSPDWKYERDERFAIQTEGAETLERGRAA